MKRISLLLIGLLTTYQVFSYDQTTLTLDSDSLKEAPNNWWHLDPSHHQVPGINTQQAYEFLKGRSSQTVLVAVIDSGIDIDHEDLKDVIWTNHKEVAGNGKDDDGNGYVDDVHGWNFIGGEDGENVEFDTYEITREYLRLQSKYQVLSESQQQADSEWIYYNKIEKEYHNTVKKMERQFAGFKGFYDQYKKAERLLQAYVDQEELSKKDLISWDSPDDKITQARSIMLTAFDNGLDSEKMEEGFEYFTTALEYGYNLDFDPRNVIGDNTNDPYEKYYGNNDVKGEFSFHGTHVAGIIAAGRSNNLGIDGIADNVEVMVLRAVPNGDERDKDVANAIRYAVDNGAQIINMSFGKRFSPNKKVVDEAVKYAESKGVLLIHAAGNSAHDTQEVDHYPSPQLDMPQYRAGNWLEVGAVSWKGHEDLVASFSNYGKTTVDVFAPGVDILSTAPDQDYEAASGTSMAAPVTTGVAALLMSYFPGLSAQEVKEIIMKSSTSYQGQKVKIPGKQEFTKFGQLSQTGGVINAYEAVKLAQKSLPRNKKLKRD
ncbi:MAG: S8 family peptidase [Cyclobacteriaceae bacterium]|nr:S8 family peptidase [Cyclobacteriaceae bacterium]